MEKPHSPRIFKLLIDHNIEGWAVRLWDTIVSEDWLELYPLEMLMFIDVGLEDTANDREVWRFAQANEMILLTSNRNMDGEDSLETTLRQENTLTSLPVLTIALIERLEEREFRERCAERLMEIILYIEKYLGVARLYIP
ncbi:MAG: ACP S-malonyltransferase [Symploca sp. SIO1A3]|nr:ACP S-malonyltransferase [Symploca sp. SIO1A3]